VNEAAASTPPLRSPTPAGCSVRLATREDLPAIAVAVCELVLELGGKPSPQPALHDAARALLEEPRTGALLVADADGGVVVGFLGASWLSAVRIPGRYGLIQELWVHPDWRSRTIGGELIAALCELAHEHGIERIEVGLPGERFARVEATEAFYRANGFAAIGSRMRRLL
jgi:branched-chain amino acid aminotransferase